MKIDRERKSLLIQHLSKVQMTTWGKLSPEPATGVSRRSPKQTSKLLTVVAGPQMLAQSATTQTALTHMKNKNRQTGWKNNKTSLYLKQSKNLWHLDEARSRATKRGNSTSARSVTTTSLRMTQLKSQKVQGSLKWNDKKVSLRTRPVLPKRQSRTSNQRHRSQLLIIM